MYFCVTRYIIGLLIVIHKSILLNIHVYYICLMQYVDPLHNSSIVSYPLPPVPDIIIILSLIKVTFIKQSDVMSAFRISVAMCLSGGVIIAITVSALVSS